MKRIYTCTPYSLPANDEFFSRDAGLICMQLRELGAESRSVMPLPFHDDDTRRDDVIRVSPEQLEDASWWQEQHLDGVVLYSRALPCFLKVAKAIRAAGIFMMMHVGPFSSETVGQKCSLPGRLWSRLKNFPLNILRAANMRCADVITTSPPVLKKLATHPLFGPEIADKCFPMPTPVDSLFAYDGTEKEDLVVVVTHRDDDPDSLQMMMKTLAALYTNEQPARTEIYGPGTEFFLRWHESLPESVSARISLCGDIPHECLAHAFNRARVCVCTSAGEEAHLASCEALCCGCSLVVPHRPVALDTVMWYAEQCGRVSAADTPASLAFALTEELSDRREGKRSPAASAARWQPLFHINPILKQIFNL